MPNYLLIATTIASLAVAAVMVDRAATEEEAAFQRDLHRIKRKMQELEWRLRQLTIRYNAAVREEQREPQPLQCMFTED